MNYFSNLQTIEEVKSRYRKLAFSLHPDRGGSTEGMQELNGQYHQALQQLNGKVSQGSDGNDHTYRYNHDIEQAVMDKLSELIRFNFPNIRIMLVGTWLWIDGDTKPVKEQLKALGFHWHQTRSLWYWHAGKYRKGRSNAPFSDIAAKYGYREYEAEKRERIAKIA